MHGLPWLLTNCLVFSINVLCDCVNPAVARMSPFSPASALNGYEPLLQKWKCASSAVAPAWYSATIAGRANRVCGGRLAEHMGFLEGWFVDQ